MIEIKIISDRITIPNEIGISVKCFYEESREKEESDVIIFLNSSFFNQNQWKSIIPKFNALLAKEKIFKYITYDYAGVGESTYNSKNLTIQDFLEEFKAVANWTGAKKIHIFGMSIGAWIGLNACLHMPDLIKSYLGFGNLAPYHEIYYKSILEFQKLKPFLDEFKHLKNEKIEESNWNNIFEHFFIPFFFPEGFNKENCKSKKILSNLIYAMAKGSQLVFFYDYYEYLIKTIIKEGNNLLKEIEKYKLRMPILFINGEKDNIANPEMAIDLNHKFHNSSLILLENIGHGSILLGKGNKLLLNTYIEFLDL